VFVAFRLSTSRKSWRRRGEHGAHGNYVAPIAKISLTRTFFPGDERGKNQKENTLLP
jgi:hypothetical protein